MENPSHSRVAFGSGMETDQAESLLLRLEPLPVACLCVRRRFASGRNPAWTQTCTCSQPTEMEKRTDQPIQINLSVLWILGLRKNEVLSKLKKAVKL